MIISITASMACFDPALNRLFHLRSCGSCINSGLPAITSAMTPIAP